MKAGDLHLSSLDDAAETECGKRKALHRHVPTVKDLHSLRVLCQVCVLSRLQRVEMGKREAIEP